MHIVGVLLAGGSGSRFGGDKLLAALEDTVAVGERALMNLQMIVPDVVAVLRPGNQALRQRFAALDAKVTTCPDAHLGMGASLAHGIATAGPADAVIVALADMPWIKPSTIRAVVTGLEGGASLVVPRYHGRRANPVGIARTHFGALRDLRNDRGARDLIDSTTDVLWIDVDDPGVVRDVDVPADLIRRSGA